MVAVFVVGFGDYYFFWLGLGLDFEFENVSENF